MTPKQRSKMAKAEGYKSVNEWYANTDPFKNSDHLLKKKVAKKMGTLEKFQKSFAGYHKDAPAFLKKETDKLHKK